MNVEKIREDFPILKTKMSEKNLVYLDSASTSQKPRQVLEAMQEFYNQHNANVHRAVYNLSVESTEMFENSRKNIAKFVNSDPSEIVFTKSTTESINVVLNSWARENLKAGDEIVLSVMEHHSNIVPWQSLQKSGVKLKFVDIDEEGMLKNFEDAVTEKTKLIAITQASNVLGTINDVKMICKLAKDNGSKTLIDGAQSVPHMETDVKEIGCDFLVFSGHKMLGPTGIGVLYGKKDMLESMPPFMLGSNIIKEVGLHQSTFMGPPGKFETGTQPIAEVIGLSAAVDYLNKIGMKNVREHDIELTKAALEGMKMDDLKIYGPSDAEKRGGVISFNLGDVHSHDVSTVMNSEGIAIRSGHHCAQPLMKRLGTSSTARASFYIYNTQEEIQYFIESLKKAREVFKLDRHVR